MSKAEHHREWWRGSSIYQVYPRSFQDTTGDGVGDLRGVIQRLPHIASLKVDAIWLSPFFKSPQADMGYDVSDYRAVDPLFGSMEDFDALIAQAHRLGLKVIIDQVISHTSDKHAWFIESRAGRTNAKADWYVWADPRPEGSPPNNWLSVFGGSAWEWEPTRRQYYMHNFLSSQPDLNFQNPAVQEAVLDAVRFWLDRGVDGFRLDTVNYYFHDRQLRRNPALPAARRKRENPANPYLLQRHLYDKSQPENIVFLKRFRALLDQYEARATVGEVGDEDRSLDTVAAYTGGGDKLNMCYTFDMLGEAFSPLHIRGCIEGFFDRVKDGWVCWAFSNHDVERHVTRWTPPGADPQALAKLAIALLASLRGSICLYQGEELGLEEAVLTYEQLRDPVGIRFWPGIKGRDGCRTPIPWNENLPNAGFTQGHPWLPVSDGSRAAAGQENDPDSVLNVYRAALEVRRNSAALRIGAIDFVDATEGVLAFVRSDHSEKILCVFNMVNAVRPFIFPPRTGEALLSNIAADAGPTQRTTCDLPPYGYIIARLK